MAFLLIAGFLGGFFLAGGSAHFLRLAPRSAVVEQEETAQDMKQAAPKKKGGTEIMRDQQEGNTSVAVQGEGKAKKAHVTGNSDDQDDSTDGAAKKPQPPGGLTLTGDQAAEFLAGNTVKLLSKDETEAYRYFSRHGWRGDQDAKGLVVHRWVGKNSRLCEFRSEDAAVCEAISIQVDPAPKNGVGARLGTLMASDQKSWPVLRGNVAKMPEDIPLVDGVRTEPGGPRPKLASATGKIAMKALLLHDLLVGNDPAGLRGLYYEPDGRWIEARPEASGATTGAAGLKVSVGQWEFIDGALCQDRPGLELTRQCFHPEQWGPTTFRLVPSLKGDAQTLLVLADAAAKQGL